MYCCTSIAILLCSKGLVGGWVGVGCTASSVVGAWAVPYVGVFLRPVGDEPFFLFLQYRPPTGCLGVPPPPLLHSSVLYYRTYCCIAVLLPCVIIFFCKTYIQRMIPLLPYVLLHCRTALLLFSSFKNLIQRIQHQFVFVRHTGRHQTYFGSTTC